MPQRAASCASITRPVNRRSIATWNGRVSQALAEIDLSSGQVRGYRPVGYFPTALQLSADGRTAFGMSSPFHSRRHRLTESHRFTGSGRTHHSRPNAT